MVMWQERVVGWAGRNGKRVGVTLAGTVLLILGAALLLLPGPGMLLIAAGFAVLATEYAWARRALWKAKRQARKTQGRVGRFVRKRI